MSASREKKQRQGELGKELTQKQRQELQEKQAAKRKAVLYTVIGVIVAVLVVILLVWHSGIFQRGAVAVSVGGHDYTVTDVEYYYHSAMLEAYYNSYDYTTGSVAFDPTGDLRKQFVDDEEETQSWHDYFLEQAMTTLTQVAATEDAAAREGFTLGEEGQATVEQAIEELRASVEQSGYPNLAGYLKTEYSRYMTVKAYRACVERDVLVGMYQSDYQERQEVTDADLEAYYEENADAMDSFDYRYILVNGEAASTTDEEGNTVEPTEEEEAAAMSAAQQQAQNFRTAVLAAEDREQAFIDLAPDYVSESSSESYAEDPDRSLSQGLVGSSLSSIYGDWLRDEDRAAGDIEVFEASSGYYVVLFLDRYLDETPTVDIRHILVKASVPEDDPETEDVDESDAAPTQEALDAAKAEAEGLLEQWQAGDKTAESFGALAQENSDDSGSASEGGLYERVKKGQMFADFDAWIFDEARQPGDTTLMENPQEGQQGWHVIYFQSWEPSVWASTADEAIRGQRLTDWIDGLTEGLEAVQADGIKYVGK